MSTTPAITRKDMKEPDRFQQAATKVAGWIAGHKRHVAVAAGALAGLAVAVAVAAAIQASRARKAGAAASELLDAIGGEISSVPIPGLPGPFYPDDAARQRAIVAAADRVLAGYPRSGAAELAALAKGDAHLKLREWDPAKAAYERFLGLAGKADSLRFGALEGIAIAEEGKGNLDAAAQAYERMAREVPAFADRADLERARVLARAGRVGDARGLLASFAEKHHKSLLAGEASSELARLGGE